MRNTRRTRKGGRDARAAPPPPSGLPRAWTGGLLALVCALAVAVYSKSVVNGFTNWDDGDNVVNNALIRELSFSHIKALFSTASIGTYMPLTMLTYAFDHAIGGSSPVPFHATSLILHLANIVAVFFFSRLLTGEAGVGLAVSLLFSVHPMNVEAVAWISARNTILCSLFYLLSLICYVKYLRESSRAHYLFSLSFFLLSLLAKPSAVSLPFVLILLDYHHRRAWRRPALVDKLPFFVLSLSFALVALAVRQPPEDAGLGYSLLDRIVISTYSVAYYVGKFFVPVHLSAYIRFPEKKAGLLPPRYYVSTVLACFAVYAAWRTRARWNDREPPARMLVLGAFLFLLPNAMVMIRLSQFSDQMVAERYAYLPYVGLLLMVAELRHVRIPRPVLLTGLAAVVVFFSVTAYARTAVWKDGTTLWSDVIDKDPSVAYAYYNRAFESIKAHDYPRAVADFTSAIAIKPDHYKAYNNRGYVRYVLLKDYAGAIADFSQVVALNPNDVAGYLNRASARFDSGDATGAIADYGKALDVQPDLAAAYYKRGQARLAVDDLVGACADWRRFQNYGFPQANAAIDAHCR